MLVGILAYTPDYKVGITACIVLTLVYRHIIAAVLGLNVMAAMDLNCFYSNPKAPVNILSVTFLSGSKAEYARELFKKIVLQHPKMRCRIVEVMGDLYYSPLEVEDVLDTQIEELPPRGMTTERQLEEFIQK